MVEVAALLLSSEVEVVEVLMTMTMKVEEEEVVLMTILLLHSKGVVEEEETMTADRIEPRVRERMKMMVGMKVEARRRKETLLVLLTLLM